MTPNVIVVGSLNMDLVVRTPRLPKTGETILGSDFRTFPGGKGANQAVAAARLGGQVAMIGRVGRDDFGEALLQSAARDGVDMTYVSKDPHAATGVALITVDEAGQNTIVVASGANHQVVAEDISAVEHLFRDSSVLVLQLELPIPAVERAAHLAHQRGMPVILNPAPAQTLSRELLSIVDYLVPNQSELALLTGQEDIEAGAGVLQDWGVRSVIITLGEAGVLVRSDGQEQLLAAHPVEAVDTVAAGDAFVGAFAVALTEGRSVLDAAAWANAAAALSVTRHGAQPSLPSRKELETFLSRRE